MFAAQFAASDSLSEKSVYLDCIVSAQASYSNGMWFSIVGLGIARLFQPALAPAVPQVSLQPAEHQRISVQNTPWVLSPSVAPDGIALRAQPSLGLRAVWLAVLAGGLSSTVASFSIAGSLALRGWNRSETEVEPMHWVTRRAAFDGVCYRIRSRPQGENAVVLRRSSPIETIRMGAVKQMTLKTKASHVRRWTMPQGIAATAACPLRSRDVLMLSGRRPSKELASKELDTELEKEKHLLFDEVEVVVRGGAGGHGAVISLPKRGEGPKLKRKADNDFALPPGGGDGGDVVLFVDPALSTLLHLRGRPVLAATRGGDSLGLLDLQAGRHYDRESVADRADAARPSAAGTAGGAKMRDGEVLRVPVPPGTFVRTKNGRVLGDLVAPRQELVVAAGGEGGPCVLRRERRERVGRRGKRRQDNLEEDVFELTDAELHEITRGKAAEELKLNLLLRTVADVGFVGFPNAGKSTLLGALSNASPEIQPFPFTTLMPNLGAMEGAAASGFATTGAASAAASWDDDSRAPVLADLPGLIDGAHQGRGLGRAFLRHLRRVRVVLYVLDTNSDDRTVGDQYDALRKELQLYNPQYLARPHVVALNKLDVALESGGEEAMKARRREALS